MQFSKSLLQAVLVPVLIFGAILFCSAQEYRTGVRNACNTKHSSAQSYLRVKKGGATTQGVTGSFSTVRPNTNRNRYSRGMGTHGLFRWKANRPRVHRSFKVRKGNFFTRLLGIDTGY